MLDLVLENNNFSCNDKHYIQTEGIAIGLHLGMNYACTCTFLADWKKELLQKSEYLPAQSLTSIQYMIAPFGKGC
jgi:hypothetical protein